MAFSGRIVRYAAALSLAAAFLTAAHLAWLYLYLGSSPVPVSGGSVSVGVVGKAPSLSAMDPKPDSAADLVMRLVFRGILRYDPAQGKAVGDLANCDVSNLADVRCYVNGGAVWDDGQPVTAHDIAATYAAYRSSVASARYADALSGSTVTEGRSGEIRFSFPKPDLVSLETLFLPVYRASEAARAASGSLSVSELSHSGPFSFTSSGAEGEFAGKERIVLDRNPAYSATPVYASRIILRFFSSEADLARARDTLHVVYSADPSVLDGLPRFAARKYLLPQHYAFFLNSETLAPGIRRALVSRVLPAAAAALTDADVAPVKDAFLGSFVPPAGTGSDLASALAAAGYLPKAERVRLARIVPAAPEAPAAGTGSVRPSAPAPEAPAAPAPRRLVRFSSPSESPAFFLSGNVLLSGTVPPGTDKVRVNGYALSKFAPGDARFYYRASAASKTLKEGKNEYVARFYSSGAETASETLVAFYAASASGSASQRAEWAASEGTAAVPPAAATGAALSSESAAPAPAASSEAAPAATPESAFLARALALPEAGFYDAELRPFTLKVAFPVALSPVMRPFLEALDSAGVRADVLDLDRAGMDALYAGSGKNYDVLLTGIGLGLFGYDLFPYFHSGQIDRGYNFPKVRDQQVDALLEKLRSSLRADQSISGVGEQLAKALSAYAVFFPMHSPYQHLLVDKNIGGVPAFDSLPASSYLADAFRGAWLRESRSPVLAGKSASGFLRFLFGETDPK